MICSMTAFGRTQKEAGGYSITVEIRTLNGRYLDIVLRLPKNYLELEEPLRKQISQAARRGRIEVFVQIESTEIEQKAPRLDIPLARYYWGQLQELQRELPGIDPPKLKHLLSIPYIFESRKVEGDREALRSILSEAVAETLKQVHDMRCREGEALLQDCLDRLKSLRQDLSIIDSRKDLILEDYQQRLRDRIQELLGEVQVDENRILQEAACSAERADINEEIVRLNSHFQQMEAMLTAPREADGRKLDFLTQELHREVNTIGSKTGDLEALQAVVRMKSEIGKLKEQVQNIE